MKQIMAVLFGTSFETNLQGNAILKARIWTTFSRNICHARGKHARKESTVKNKVQILR